MVKLVVWNFNDVSDLERELSKTDIEYQLCLDLEYHGIKVPYLIVDGVPLDNERAMKWIRSKANEH